MSHNVVVFTVLRQAEVGALNTEGENEREDDLWVFNPKQAERLSLF